MGIAKNKGQLTGNLVKMCSEKMKKHYPKETNPVNGNEFTWTKNERQEIGSSSISYYCLFFICPSFQTV